MEAPLIENPLSVLTAVFGAISIIAGIIMRLYPPRTINPFYGYKTTSSMKDQLRWDFAQKYSAKLMLKLGLINAVIALLSTALSINVTVSMVIGLTIVIISVIVLIFKTEWALKCHFN